MGTLCIPDFGEVPLSYLTLIFCHQALAVTAGHHAVIILEELIPKIGNGLL
jgi:hypothetical protein